MIRYRYAKEVSPPAPFVHVTIHSGDGARRSREVLAQVDPGATRTILPAEIVEELVLEQMEAIAIAGVGGHISSVPTYLVRVEIRHLAPVEVTAAAHPDEPYVLLGRDVLNHFRLVLDGPRLTLEIS